MSTNATKLRRATTDMESASLNLIFRMETYERGQSKHYERSQRLCLLEEARAYAAAVRRLARLRP